MEPFNQAPQQNPYDFIMQPPQKPKRSLFGGSMKNRIFLVVCAVVLLIIVGSIVSAILSSAAQATVRDLKDVIAKQEELIRIAELGAKDGFSVDTRNYAKTVSLNMKTDQAKMIDILGKNGGKLAAAEQNAARNARTDEALESAKANNQYDNVLAETLTRQLNAYLTSLKAAYDRASGPNTKEVLSQSYAHANTLLAPAQDQ